MKTAKHAQEWIFQVWLFDDNSTETDYIFLPQFTQYWLPSNSQWFLEYNIKKYHSVKTQYMKTAKSIMPAKLETWVVLKSVLEDQKKSIYTFSKKFILFFL